MRLGLEARDVSARLMRLAIILAVLFLALYVFIYIKQPFPGNQNDLWLNVLTPFSAAMSAVAVTMVWLKFDSADAPRKIWNRFAIAIWLWAVAEILWSYYTVKLGEAGLGPQDLFWIAAYYFMAEALVRQYHLLAQPAMRYLIYRIIMMVLVTILLTVFTAAFLGRTADITLEDWVNSFYPAADLAIAVAAVWLVRHFSGGALARPWLSLLVFTFSDSLFAWLDASDKYAWSLAQTNFLSALSDTIYVAAYVVLALGAFSQWLFLKYGLRSPTKAR